MKQTDFPDVPEELGVHRVPSCSVQAENSGGNKPLPQSTILAEILYKCLSGCP